MNIKIEELRFYNTKPSNTSIIKYGLPELSFIRDYKERIMYSEDPEEGMRKFDETMKNACIRGSYVHRFLEEYFKGNLNFYNEDPRVLAYVNGAINFLNSYGQFLVPKKIRGEALIETPFVGKDFAGTADMFCHAKNMKGLGVVDFKTASKAKLDQESLHRYKLQLAGNTMLYEELYNDEQVQWGMLQVITDKRKNGIGEQYIVTRAEILDLIPEFDALRKKLTKALEGLDLSSLPNYMESDNIMSMDRKI